MRTRTRLVLLASLTLAGCDVGPPDIVPMTPPGISPIRNLAEDSGEALGEQRGAPAAAESSAPTPAPAPAPK